MKRRSKKQWQAIISKQQQSGMSAAQFCRSMLRLSLIVLKACRIYLNIFICRIYLIFQRLFLD